MIWNVEILEGHGKDLAAALARVTVNGYAVQYVLPNGINRWTIVAAREAGQRSDSPPMAGPTAARDGSDRLMQTGKSAR